MRMSMAVLSPWASRRRDPDTGYGYIEFEKGDTAAIRKVRSFREKPDMLAAKKYVEAGNFAWNSGLFIWKLESIH